MKIEIKPKYGFVILAFAFIALYSLFQARAILLGPQISIVSPKDGEVVGSPLVTVEGWGRNIGWISMNDRQIFTDEEGHWSEKLIVSEGTSIITVVARDRFGRETRKNLHIVLN